MSLSIVFDRLAEGAAQWCASTPLPKGMDEDEAYKREAAYRLWMMSRFLSQQGENLYAELPDRGVVRLPDRFVWRPGAGDRLFDDTPRGWDEIIRAHWLSFSQLKHIAFDVTAPREDDPGTFGSMVDLMAAALVSLRGTPVLWKLPDQKAIDWDKVCGVPMPKGKVGRPRKVEKVADALLRKYPDYPNCIMPGRKALHDELEKDLTMSFSLDTLGDARKLVMKRQGEPQD